MDQYEGIPHFFYSNIFIQIPTYIDFSLYLCVLQEFAIDGEGAYMTLVKGDKNDPFLSCYGS